MKRCHTNKVWWLFPLRCESSKKSTTICTWSPSAAVRPPCTLHPEGGAVTGGPGSRCVFLRSCSTITQSPDPQISTYPWVRSDPTAPAHTTAQLDILVRYPHCFCSVSSNRLQGQRSKWRRRFVMWLKLKFDETQDVRCWSPTFKWPGRGWSAVSLHFQGLC